MGPMMEQCREMMAAMTAFAHHPGERLDEVMAEKEPAFEPTDLRSIPTWR